MNLSDFQKQLLVALVRSRLDGGKLFRSYDELSGLVTLKPQGADGLAGSLDRLSQWMSDQSLPDVTTVIVPPENAERMRMLPAQSIIDRYHGEMGVRAEADRVRDFDWAGWLHG